VVCSARRRALAAALAVAFGGFDPLAPRARQQPAPVRPALVVDGNVPTRLSLSLEMLKQVGSIRVQVDRQGGLATYEGVPLVELLRRAGVNIGRAPLRGPDVTAIVSAVGPDGFRAVFALAELDPAAADGRVIVAYARDGRALGADEGPLRIVAPADKYPVRWIRNIVRLTVSDAGASSPL
jgi:DMSO/TMAO reductase YedYZ molybdopterin-dependent catalytic subunit